jgi:hypothetical protein
VSISYKNWTEQPLRNPVLVVLMRIMRRRRRRRRVGWLFILVAGFVEIV